MSRSRKKVSIPTINAGSMKWWKTYVNKSVRHRAKQAINTCQDFDNLIILVPDDVGSIWTSPKEICWISWSPYRWYSHYFDEWNPGLEKYEKGFRK